jgi:threonyl-tRNA synthetase
MFDPLAPSCPIWLPSGNTVYSILSDKIRKFNLSHGYVEVRTPSIYKKELFEQSGHLEHYSKNMFFVGDDQCLKPMNCPAHMLIFGARKWSYRELPYRIHDQGSLFRNEISGSLSGLSKA